MQVISFISIKWNEADRRRVWNACQGQQCMDEVTILLWLLWNTFYIKIGICLWSRPVHCILDSSWFAYKPHQGAENITHSLLESIYTKPTLIAVSCLWISPKYSTLSRPKFPSVLLLGKFPRDGHHLAIKMLLCFCTWTTHAACSPTAVTSFNEYEDDIVQIYPPARHK